MVAYHNDPAIKAKILIQLQLHREYDQLVKGQYWQNGKGCAVGCTIYSGDHAEYESRFGIPQVLARLEDRLFEGLPNALAMEWPQRFMLAIRPGADLSMIWPHFALWLCTDELPQHTKSFPQATRAIEGVATLYQTWIDTGIIPSRAAANAAYAAANAAYAAAGAAYAAAYAAYAAAYAAYAARAAARAAAYVAYVAYAARAAARAAAGVADAADAARAAYAAAYERMSNKLIELLEAA